MLLLQETLPSVPATESREEDVDIQLPDVPTERNKGILLSSVTTCMKHCRMLPFRNFCERLFFCPRQVEEHGE